MKYTLMFTETEAEMARRETADAPAYWQAWGQYIDLLIEAGVLTPGQGAGLQAPHTATTVRIVEGKHLVQDGPFAQTKELLGGFVVIDVASLDEALEWAAKAPCASAGAVEVRPNIPLMA